MADSDRTYLHVPAVGDIAEVPAPSTLNLADEVSLIQRIVGGYFEAVRINDVTFALVNEEGRLYGLDENVRASVVAGQLLVGDAVFVSDDGGEEHGSFTLSDWHELAKRRGLAE